MRTSSGLDGHQRISTGPGSYALLFVFAWMVAGLSACGTVNFERGEKIDTEKIERVLRAGEATQADVQQALGKPFGVGRALMPYHESVHTLWIYQYMRGSAGASSFEVDSDLTLLYVFFADDVVDGYVWGAGKLQSKKLQ